MLVRAFLFFFLLVWITAFRDSRSVTVMCSTALKFVHIICNLKKKKNTKENKTKNKQTTDISLAFRFFFSFFFNECCFFTKTFF